MKLRGVPSDEVKAAGSGRHYGLISLQPRSLSKGFINPDGWQEARTHAAAHTQAPSHAHTHTHANAHRHTQMHAHTLACTHMHTVN